MTPVARSADADADAGTQVKVVFVSSVGGLDGADAKCNALAEAAGLTGTFRAWLSDATGSPATRFTHPEVDYVLVDGTVFAHGWTALTTGGAGAVHALNLTERVHVHGVCFER